MRASETIVDEAVRLSQLFVSPSDDDDREGRRSVSHPIRATHQLQSLLSPATVRRTIVRAAGLYLSLHTVQRNRQEP